MKHQFWWDLGDVIQSIPRVDMVKFSVEMMVKAPEPMGRLGIQDRNAEGNIVVDFRRRMERSQMVRRCFRAAH